MLKPDIYLERVTMLTPKMLNTMGVKGLLLDVDNTMSTHHGTELLEGLEEWIAKMGEHGIPLIILSNSKNKRVEPFAKNIGLPFVSLGLKPLPIGFIRAAKMLKIPLKSLALCGDQVFTDYLGARITGVKIVLLKPIKPEDKLSFKIRRSLEHVLLKNVKKGRYQ